MKLILNSLSDTEAFAQKMADRLKDKTMTITLDGDLGAGKTAWTRFFGKALGVKRTINSPTFTIMKSYRTQDGSMLYHMDAYRLEDGNQDLGFEECFEEGLCVVEWSNYIAQQIPADHIAISIRETGETSREVIMEATGKNAQAVLEGWE
ncbi:tRNA (adenosine(37)-N6)-threonylcarbamoyltransferase complex ATPase subunit type 1 TsaE [Allobaculum stercoricanis]|uniref:tRNA (adenosine(37)-N6)-threonylcarbamoyltransferase complex ATPase subunit type 1 TsaE n=1 Tax=Allobaculum stercoricanis TaxID=174709 RepID=UPI0023F52F30|nr:tRNA (adenosine(37)-N6)-threonylcarbamoyltransferase complex ATPase subunit type 1 TsaE [Allobaculum stercoricanis]